MPDMPKRTAIAALIADLHLTLTPPACRSDKNWLAVQARYLKQVKATGLPVICAGDIFDRWNVCPELINFALQYLPDGMLAVPGQHDLPNHRLDLMHRSGYGVLVRAGKIVDLSDEEWFIPTGHQFVAYGFGWGQKIKPPTNKSTGIPHVAVVHQYIWTADKKFPDAPPSANVSALKKDLSGYSAAVFGDNHKGFLIQVGDCQVLNVGGFIRRKSDEIEYEPCFGVLWSDGSVTRSKFDTELDSFHPVKSDRPEAPFNMRDFLSNLESLGEHGLDFREAITNHCRTADVPAKTKEIILSVIEAT